MSQALTLRVKALEERVALLESLRNPPFEAQYHVAHRGFGHWFVEAPDGTTVNTKGLTREEADSLASEMNDASEGLSAA